MCIATLSRSIYLKQEHLNDNKLAREAYALIQFIQMKVTLPT